MIIYKQRLERYNVLLFRVHKYLSLPATLDYNIRVQQFKPLAFYDKVNCFAHARCVTDLDERRNVPVERVLERLSWRQTQVDVQPTAQPGRNSSKELYGN